MHDVRPLLEVLSWAFEPILIFGLAWMFLKEPIDRLLGIVVTVAFIGVLLVSGLISGSSAISADIGSFLILAGVLCCAIYTVLARNIDADPLFTVALQQTVAFVDASNLAYRTPSRRDAVHCAIPIADIVKIIVSGLLYYAAAYWLYLQALRSMPASVAGSFFNLIPVFGIIGSLVFLGERLGPLQWVGAVMIIGAAVIVLRRQHDSPVADSEAERCHSQLNSPLSALDEHQLDDLGITSEQASEIEKRARHRREQ